jgi:dihydrofolate synthase / folylpolyglutamate synthase
MALFRSCNVVPFQGSRKIQQSWNCSNPFGTHLVTYDQAISQLYKLGHELSGSPHKFDLEYVRVLLRELGNPERNFKSVLIAGTNGKGSTAATLASILAAAGHRTGLYTSPHLIRINERIRVNGAEIGNDDLARVYDRVEAAAQKLVAGGEIPWHPSFFEMLTAMAFQHLAEARVEVAVLEVGMGGRLDATNVIDLLVSVITDISLDHQKYLGNTITEIAGEKAGIIRPNGVVVTLPQHPEANNVIGNTVLERGARMVSAVPYVPPVSPGASGHTSYALDVMGEQITVESPLVGRHQLRNVALAIAAAEELNRAGISIRARDIERGIRETRWPGRFQAIPATAGRPEIVLDGAHNPAGAWALRSALSDRYSGRDITIVFGVMRDKDVREVAEILFPIARRVIVTQANNPRSATPEEISAATGRISADILEAGGVEDALGRACGLASSDRGKPLVVIAGSIYIVGEALELLGSAGPSA